MIGEPRFIRERLGLQHDRASFTCAREATLEDYLRNGSRAKRDNDKSVAAVYVLIDKAQGDKVAGYFTISNTIIVPTAVPDAIAKKLPRYDSWGAVKLGRMARDDAYADMGIGSILIAHAFSIALSIEKATGSLALVVDAKNASLTTWYASLGFRTFNDEPLKLFIVNALMAGYLTAIAKAEAR